MTTLRDVQERVAESRLEALLLEGLTSGGKDLPLNRSFWADLRSDAAALGRKQRKEPERDCGF